MPRYSDKKIVARIFGGLGNQLFIYSAARRLAVVNDAELVLDDVSGFVRDIEYRRHYQLKHFNVSCRLATADERMEPFSRVRRYLKRRSEERRPFLCRAYVHQEGMDYDPRVLMLRPQGTLYLEGYWQSESYFKDIEPIIREDLQIKRPSDANNSAMAEYICRHPAVAIHIRFFDDPVKPKNINANNVQRSYYSRAVQAMEARIRGAHYFVFSDFPEAARSCISLPDDRITLLNHNHGDIDAYADLWLMSQCQHFIIANSTFSWWGAWLASNRNKVVIAPGTQMRGGVTSWGFKGLLPKSWEKL